ncbi:Quinolinate phosphoribosyltransferase [decarboxylating] [Candidatus Syntrophocurvum alkaliphilum]|uniref:Probable nicotinate-nucleotide pyrophosphorylase [carboxylating] n=1 Tax=Candidatus Syntrophocurvum alkaliphilum TaxID=2293317 RepID=A0A6I6DHV1_9FIRM|nr:carboxylating nicotinate-nucleotide diphosphorylase [Candidatus Syntrophocurvum alkaliphilum]QGU00504.1 Quinolinate phosphoribosyltransferase [decarboxylating] [Candidatus Syntrophocurvum alkaliphilum]
MNFLRLDEIILRALEEDIGHSDITTSNLIPSDQMSKARFYAKADGIVAGINVSKAVFEFIDHEIEFEILIEDGQPISEGDTIATVKGKTATLLTGERTALNFLQRLSGIATKTKQMTELIKYNKAEIVDTRKTTPGLRVLEKYAVSVGGARNHRFGLYDGVMIKDNHIKAVGSIQKAVTLVRNKIPHTINIEIEVETLEQLQEALESKAEIIMLDNMSVDEMKKAVEITDGQAILEASGGINEDTLPDIAKTGVDYISVGALTHSAISLDISFDLLEIDI